MEPLIPDDRKVLVDTAEEVRFTAGILGQEPWADALTLLRSAYAVDGPRFVNDP